MIKALTLGFLLSVVTLFSQLVAANPYADTIRSFSNAGETVDYFKTAYGYAVFPTIGKGGLVVGGAHGEGKVFIDSKHVGNATMTQITAGAQIGGQAFSQIIFFENEQAFRYFTSESFEFSAQATAVAITAGVSAEANTGGGVAVGISGGRNDAKVASAGYRKGLAVFTIAKG
ncbi:MAG: lipid-binding SYLF domain-containing protein, partial [Halioglobus sp.]|nr:lipid-binding SYLF domain-containing protein [Halioglobus sp.]